MDFGFISGPGNLEDMINKGMKATPNLVTDRHGNTAFLLIICAATRYIWVFPVKSKHQPLTIIDKFLKKHGKAHGRTVNKITTTPGGILSKSKSFDRLITETHQLTKAEAELELNMDYGNAADEPTVDAPLNTIRTDQGGELARSGDFQQTVLNHGYLLETTGPDASSQNGLAERPNRTLKERVRCLLYTAGLGTEFWSDALIHAAWLYNRTFHRSIDKTPFEAWTGRKPMVADVLTFGTKLTAKVSDKRQPALDPNSFDGIFLGYTATTSIVRYWDVHTRLDKTAHHATFDELHYGSNPATRPPAACHLVEVFTGSPQEERSSHELKEKPFEVIPTATQPGPMTNEQIIDESPPSFDAILKAVAVPLHRPEEGLIENINNLDITLDLCDPAITELISLHDNKHPMCGLELIPHPEYKDTVVLQGIVPGTNASKTIRRWKSRLRHSIVRMVEGIPITSTQQFRDLISELRLKKRHEHAKIKLLHFARPRWAHMTGDGLPTLAFDQLNVIAHHLSTTSALCAIRTNTVGRTRTGRTYAMKIWTVLSAREWRYQR